MAHAHSVLEDDESDSSADGELAEDLSDDLSSSPSVPDAGDIDFDAVYALHTFLATVDGQASVSKGDHLTLLDDSNSYWWLVRVLKTQAVGYIPAENIETPFERLARLNKHRNVDVSSATQEDHATGPGSAQAKTRIVPAQSPSGTRTSPYQGPPNGKSVAFTAPTYFEHSGAEDDEEDGDGEDDEDDSEGYIDEDDGDDHADDIDDGDTSRRLESRQIASADAQARSVHAQSGRAVRLDDDGDVELDDGDYGPAELVEGAHRADAPEMSDSDDDAASSPPARRVPAHTARGAPLASDGAAAAMAGAVATAGSGSSRPAAAAQGDARASPTRAESSSLASAAMTAAASAQSVPLALAAGGTRKITLTPDIARESSSPPAIAITGSAVRSSLRAAAMMVSHQPVQPARAGLGESHAAGVGGDLEPGRSTEASDAAHKLKRATPPTSATSATSATDEAAAEANKKKKSSGGMFGGLFRKKERTRAEDDIAGASSAPASPLEPKAAGPTGTAEDPYLAEATLRQQQVEARQALYTNYGISRGIGDASNTFVARSSSLEASTLSPRTAYGVAATPAGAPADASAVSPSRPKRPGSLLGSPSALVEAPMLSVMRVFAGDEVPAEATFKTVLLNDSTTGEDLLRQALQRFRLPLLDVQRYSLCIKDSATGETQPLLATQHPLPLLERLNDHAHAVPSVKRSSVGSISSLSSNLSTHPAIERLGMHDYSDDSAVKIYLVPHGRHTAQASGSQPGAAVDARMVAAGNGLRPHAARPELLTLATARQLGVGSTYTPTRFAARLILSAADLPDGLHFDSRTSTLVPLTALDGREADSAGSSERERILALPSSMTVAETIEVALERYGVLDGVVHGGDDIEDRATKRRSMSRVRYCLVSRDGSGREALLPPTSRLFDAYRQPPALIALPDAADGSRRRSVDAPGGFLPSSDAPSFLLRNFARMDADRKDSRSGAADGRPTSTRSIETAPSAVAIPRPAEPAHQLRPPAGLHRAGTSDTVYMTPDEELPAMSAWIPPPTAVATPLHATPARSGQRMSISARQNDREGVDIRIANRSTLRSSRQFGNVRVRYSYIDHDGAEYDVSDIIEAEWLDGGHEDHRAPVYSAHGSAAAGGVSPSRDGDADLLEGALAVASSPRRADAPSELSSQAERQGQDLEQRIDRVLARVHAGRLSGVTSAMRGPSAAPEERTAIASARSPHGPQASRVSRSDPSVGQSPKGGAAPSRAAAHALRPAHRFDDSIDRLAAIVLYQPAPGDTQRLLVSAHAPAPANARIEDALLGRQVPRELLAATRRWFGASLDQVEAIECRVDEMLAQVMAQT